MTLDRTGWVAEIPALFPTLAKLEPEAAAHLGNVGQRVNVPRGTVLFRAGDRCHSFMMILEGAVRVQMASETGREIVLYRVGRGETCIVATACLLTGMMMLAFGRIDLRLARFLVNRRDGGLDTTHQTLAVELGTACEAVSRQLKGFERHGLVALSRDRIQLLDPAARWAWHMTYRREKDSYT